MVKYVERFYILTVLIFFNPLFISALTFLESFGHATNLLYQ